MRATTDLPEPDRSPVPSVAPVTSPQRFAVGIDVGGTKIAAGLVDVGNGTLCARQEIPTHAERGGQAVLDAVRSMTEALIRAAGGAVAAIGVGVCELVDPDGEVQSAHTVAWPGLPVQAVLGQLASATVESDVRAHALAEAWFGAGADFGLFAFVTVGTGISSAIVINRTPIAGARGNALVLASAPVEVPAVDPEPGCSQVRPPPHAFVLEEYAAGPALLARYQAATGTALAHGRELFALATANDPDAIEILDSAGAALGNSIAFLVNIIDPAAVIIGGGLGMAGGVYWASMEAATRRAIYAEATRSLPIRPAQLGADAGIIGAALAAYRRHAGQHKHG